MWMEIWVFTEMFVMALQVMFWLTHRSVVIWSPFCCSILWMWPIQSLQKKESLLNKSNEKSNIDPLNRPLCDKTCSSLTLHRSNNVAAESTVAFTGWTTDLINHFIKVWFLGSYKPHSACNYWWILLNSKSSPISIKASLKHKIQTHFSGKCICIFF